MASTAIAVKDQTYARSQFIALGVGVIVGRCGRRSPASALTPSSLSLIGRDWVVVPERHVVVELKAGRSSQYAKFGVSPTLGLISRPEIVGFSSGRWIQTDRKFHGWVGPHCARDRFALVTWKNPSDGARCVCVLDMKTGRRVAASLTDGISGFDLISSTRRWAVTAYRRGEVMSLWNFDRVETGEVKVVEGITLPGEPSAIEVDDLGDLLVVVFGGLQSDRRMLITTDLPSTLATGGLGNYMSYDVAFKKLWCWNRTMYSSGIDCSLSCVTTGKSTVLPPNSGFTPIGGPYYAIKIGSLWEIYSVVEPTKLVCRHRADRRDTILFGQQLVVKEPGMTTTTPNHIEVIDAVSGFVIFKIPDSAQSSVSPIPRKCTRLQSLASKAEFVYFVELLQARCIRWLSTYVSARKLPEVLAISHLCITLEQLPDETTIPLPLATRWLTVLNAVISMTEWAEAPDVEHNLPASLTCLPGPAALTTCHSSGLFLKQYSNSVSEHCDSA
ncbi:hypothetical protein Pelo_7218 [Pelomyxa schiedti]|nr:hypothetical protein Pelo_7218 [Pelomyxa schiedti]